MKYDIAAIETTYKGITFRSRLEATWAAFFDLCGWNWAYETDPFGPWLPDFWIKADAAFGGMILVEVKPVFSMPDDVIKKIEAACPPHDCMVLGLGPFADINMIVEGRDPASLGWLTDLGFGLCAEEIADPSPQKVWENGGCWAEAPFDRAGGFGVNHSVGIFGNRMSGARNGGRCPVEAVPIEDAQAMWGAAKNAVRYRPR